MELDTDVLIVGGGPSGLMMACQLVRFGISFRIIDKAVDRARESRAIAIQAKSMEIFQNLGCASEFLSHAITGTELYAYAKGKLRFNINFSHLHGKLDTPFPSIYFLPQSETEQILITHLDKCHEKVERQTELLSFIQRENSIEVTIRNHLTSKDEVIYCRYLVGCDGAHSSVREQLNIPFVGGSYQQKFFLADVSIKMPFPKDKFSFFLSDEGILLSIPLYQGKDIHRLIIASLTDTLQYVKKQPSIEEIENLAKRITGADIQLHHPLWISSFFLHHRAVEQYQKGNVFVAGDAAHIHSPAGGQGMNTGFQDVANLAWKLALVIKYNAHEELLETYQLERQRVGKILLKTTDRIFNWMISRHKIITFIRQYIFPFVMSLLTKWQKFYYYLFRFISELGIRYHENPFISEHVEGADAQFLMGPHAGCRAPDAPINHTTLFEILRNKPFNILLFQSAHDPEQDEKMNRIEQLYPDLFSVHKYIHSKNLKLLFDRYGIASDGMYCIRPDGYIGFRAFGKEVNSLLVYMNRLLASHQFFP